MFILSLSQVKISNLLQNVRCEFPKLESYPVVVLSGTVSSRLPVTLQGGWQYDWPDSLKKEEVLFWGCAPRNG
jgi:hypothetical protein